MKSKPKTFLARPFGRLLQTPKLPTSFSLPPINHHQLFAYSFNFLIHFLYLLYHLVHILCFMIGTWGYTSLLQIQKLFWPDLGQLWRTFANPTFAIFLLQGPLSLQPAKGLTRTSKAFSLISHLFFKQVIDQQIIILESNDVLGET